MEQAQAVKQVLQIKKQYEDTARSNPGFQSTPEAQALSQQASALRQQYNIDDAKYGGGASLADAMTNYYKEFGGSGGQQQAPPQQQQQMGGDMSQVTDMYKQASSDFLASQSANLQAQMQQQITQLEQAYAQAISEGKISIRDAEQQFNAQKAQIEKSAYQQAEATKGYSSEMGIANSQQAIGLQQNDRARTNSMNNANASDRDVRIANIQDRISALSLQKNLGVTNAKNQYQIGMQGATAQASQMYNQSVGGMMEKDYFSDKEMSHDVRMADKQFGQQVDLAELGQRYNIENMSIDQQNRLAQMDYQANINAKEATTAFERRLKEMQFGSDLDMKKLMASLSYSGGGSSGGGGTARIQDVAQDAIDAEWEATVKYGMSLGLSRAQLEGTSNPYYLIEQLAQKRGIQYSAEQAKAESDWKISEAVKTEHALIEMENLGFGDTYKPNAPTSLNNSTNPYSPNAGAINNATNNLTGNATNKYNEEMSEYEKKMKAQADFLKKHGIEQ